MLIGRQGHIIIPINQSIMSHKNNKYISSIRIIDLQVDKVSEGKEPEMVEYIYQSLVTQSEREKARHLYLQKQCHDALKRSME